MSILIMTKEKTECVNNRKQKGLINCFCLYYLCTFVVNATYYAFGSSPVYSFASLVSKMLIIISISLQLVRIINDFRYSKGVFIIFLLVFFFFNYVIASSKEGYWDELSGFALYVLPVLIVFLCITDYSLLLRVLFLSSIVVSIAAFLFFVIRFSFVMLIEYEDNMGFANSLVIPCISLQNEFFNRKSIVAGILALLLISICVAIGSRGALLCMLVFFLLCFIKGSNEKKFNFLKVMKIVIVLIAFAFAINFKFFITIINEYLENIGVFSRTLWILQNDFMHLSGREPIYEAIINEVIDNPFRAHGIGGSIAVANGYAHNLFLQLLCENGVILGLLFSLIISVFLVRTISRRHDSSAYSMLLVIMFSASFPRLMFSGSVWSSAELWIWLVLVFKSLHIRVLSGVSKY